MMDASSAESGWHFDSKHGWINPSSSIAPDCLLSRKSILMNKSNTPPNIVAQNSRPLNSKSNPIPTITIQNSSDLVNKSNPTPIITAQNSPQRRTLTGTASEILLMDLETAAKSWPCTFVYDQWLELESSKKPCDPKVPQKKSDPVANKSYNRKRIRKFSDKISTSGTFTYPDGTKISWNGAPPPVPAFVSLDKIPDIVADRWKEAWLRTRRSVFDKILKGGAVPIEEYTGYKHSIASVCAKGHLFNAWPVRVLEKDRLCADCNGHPRHTSQQVWQEVKKIITDSGGKIKEKFVDIKTPIKCECANEHTSKVLPDRVLLAKIWCGECRKLKRQRSEQTPWNQETFITVDGDEAKWTDRPLPMPMMVVLPDEHVDIPEDVKFPKNWLKGRRRVFDIMLKQEIIPTDDYRNRDTSVPGICAAGHKCEVLPYSSATVKNPQYICRICKNPPELRFYAKVKEEEAKVLGKWQGVFKKIQCECKGGHKIMVSPSSVLWPTSDNHEFCSICSGRNPELLRAQGKESFEECIDQLEGVVTGEYVNMKTPVDCICKNLHKCRPLPSNIVRGGGMCAGCVGQDQKLNEARFRAKIKSWRGIVKGTFRNLRERVECECPEGHTCFALPATCLAGIGYMCRECNQSLGELRVKEILNELKVPWEEQFYITKQEGLNPRRYDFKIGNIIVEFDGQQHFEHSKYFHRGNDVFSFEGRRKIDIEKTGAALKAGFRIIRIHYKWLKLPQKDQVDFIRLALASQAPFIVNELAPYAWLSQFNPIVVSTQQFILRFINQPQQPKLSSPTPMCTK